MARRLFQRIFPHPDRLKKNPRLRRISSILARRELWHLTRHSVARAFAIGMFWMIMPMPLQMVPAALCAMYFRANVGIAVVLCWVSNPLTMAPFMYGTYRLGRFVLGEPTPDAEFHASPEWILANARDIGWPFLLGSLVAGVVMSIGSYVGVHALWRWNVWRRWQRSRRNVLVALTSQRALRPDRDPLPIVAVDE
jgi:uncharacterized protein (DUF2062 family)